MWRVFYIFQNPTKKKQVTIINMVYVRIITFFTFTQFIQDWHMVLIAMVVTGISICLVTLATAATILNQFVVKILNVEDPKATAVSF